MVRSRGVRAYSGDKFEEWSKDEARVLMESPLPANRAEGGVDAIVRERFFPQAGFRGVFVDIGAARPDFLSISALFRQLGWRVIAVEPNPAFCDLHRKKGHDILQYACGDHDEDDVDFVVVDSHGTQYANGQVSYESFSSLAIKESYRALKPDLDTRKIKVRLRRLDTILRDHAPDVEHIDILSVDTEGWELEVIRGLSVDRYRPTVMVIENLFNSGQYRKHMDSLGYLLWRYIPPNDVYVDRRCITPFERYAVVPFQLLFAAIRKRLFPG